MTEKQYLYGDLYFGQINYINSKERDLRLRIVDYYNVCMSEEYENFNYIKSLIKKNKSIGILSNISTDIITEEISKYIKKHEFTYKPYNKEILSDIWSVNGGDIEEFYLNKIIQQFPECYFWLYNDRQKLNLIEGYPCIEMIQNYKKSEEYKIDRRDRIEEKKQEINIHNWKTDYFKNKKELTYILDNIINLEDTLNNFAGITNVNDYLTLTYKNEEDENDNNIYKLEFKKCKKIVKMYKKTNDIYDNNGKTIYRFKTFPKGEPPRKLESLLCNTISTNKFSITGDMDAGWFVGMKLYKKRDLYDDYHLYEE